MSGSNWPIFDVWSGFISRSVYARLQVSVTVTTCVILVNIQTHAERQHYNQLRPIWIAQPAELTRVSAAVDRPAWRSDSAHTKYSISHHMFSISHQTISSTRPSCWTQISTMDVINIAADHKMFMTLTGELSWQRLRRSAAPEIWLVLTKILMVHVT